MKGNKEKILRERKYIFRNSSGENLVINGSYFEEHKLRLLKGATGDYYAIGKDSKGRDIVCGEILDTVNLTRVEREVDISQKRGK